MNRNSLAPVWLSVGLLCVAIATFTGLTWLVGHETTAFADEQTKADVTFTETEEEVEETETKTENGQTYTRKKTKKKTRSVTYTYTGHRHENGKTIWDYIQKVGQWSAWGTLAWRAWEWLSGGGGG